MAVRRFCPPLKVAAGRERLSGGSSFFASFKISSRLTAFPTAMRIFSSGEKERQSRSSWKTAAVRSPSSPRISPLSQASSPRSMWRSVVFPMPEAPVRQ